MLFELLTGRMPFEGTTSTEIIDHILHQDPPPPSRYITGVPAALDAVVARALEKSPDFRYQSAREIYTDLKAVAAELDAQPRRTSRISAAVPAPVDAIGCCVAVMTFANITREPADDWIGTGIAETVSSDLKNVHNLSVIGRARVYDALRNLSTDAHLNDSLAIDIGRRLGRDLGGGRRLSAARHEHPDHRELRRGGDRRGAADREGRRQDRRHLRAAGQDRLRADARGSTSRCRAARSPKSRSRRRARSRPTRATRAA